MVPFYPDLQHFCERQAERLMKLACDMSALIRTRGKSWSPLRRNTAREKIRILSKDKLQPETIW